MNFGIIADETILEAREIASHLEIENIKSTWRDVQLPKLLLYEFKTNSTNSHIHIISCGFKV